MADIASSVHDNHEQKIGPHEEGARVSVTGYSSEDKVTGCRVQLTVRVSGVLIKKAVSMWSWQVCCGSVNHCMYRAGGTFGSK